MGTRGYPGVVAGLGSKITPAGFEYMRVPADRPERPRVSVGFNNIMRVLVGFENFDVHFCTQFWPNFIKKKQKYGQNGILKATI